MDHISDRYGVERKDAEELQKKAGKMAGAMAAFCERMGHRDLALLISRFQVSCTTHALCHTPPCLPAFPAAPGSLTARSLGGAQGICPGTVLPSSISLQGICAILLLPFHLCNLLNPACAGHNL